MNDYNEEAMEALYQEIKAAVYAASSVGGFKTATVIGVLEMVKLDILKEQDE